MKAFHEIKPENHHKQGECPCCGSTELEYGVLELEGEQCAYPYTCRNCSFTGKEWYRLEFIEHTED